MVPVLTYLMLVEGLDFGTAAAIINLYGSLSGNTAYRVPDTLLTTWTGNLTSTIDTDHTEFKTKLAELKIIAANKSSIRLG